MNAIIALCHFCDTDGPRTLFCTQAFKYSDLAQQGSDLQKNGLKLGSDLLIPLNSLGNDSASSTTKTISPDITNNFKKNPFANGENCNLTCKACRAFEKNFHHYISYDNDNIVKQEPGQTQHDDNLSPASNSPPLNSSFSTSNSQGGRQMPNGSNICYISQSKPSDPEVYAIVRRTCIRTLHCEVFEDPIYFDDVQNGSVIGYEFRIKDSEGRGFQRSYSLVIIMKDRIYLQHLWSFFSTQMAIIAGNIKKEAQNQFDKEMKANPIHIASQRPTSSHLQANMGSNNRLKFFDSRTGELPVKKQIRGLIELTGDSKIFAKLHMWFTWILRMSSCQISEEFIHGPLSEDIQIKIEREQQLNEFIAFDKLNTISTNNTNSISSNNKSHSRNSIDELEHANSNNNEIGFDVNEIPKDSKIDEFRFQTENDIAVDNFQVGSLRKLMVLIGAEMFHKIAYNTIVGNQVIIHGKSERLISSIIRILETLIPLGCCQTVYFSSEYIKSYQCNLLGLSDKVAPSSPINNDENSNMFGDSNEFIYLRVDVQPHEQQAAENNVNECNCLNMETRDALIMGTLDWNVWLEIIKKNNEVNLTVHSNVTEFNKAPTVLTKIESFLLNDKLEEKSINSLIKLVKEEWLNKAKVFYKFVKSTLPKNENATESVLKMLSLSSNDELALKYWQSGLSNECKLQIRNV